MRPTCSVWATVFSGSHHNALPRGRRATHPMPWQYAGAWPSAF